MSHRNLLLIALSGFVLVGCGTGTIGDSEDKGSRFMGADMTGPRGRR